MKYYLVLPTLTLMSLVSASAIAASSPEKALPADVQVSTVTCKYAGEEYSVYAQLPNGQICNPDGTWSYPEKK